MNEKTIEEKTVSRRKALGTLLGGAAAALTVTNLQAFGNETVEINDLAELDKMAVKPNKLAMARKIQDPLRPWV